MGALLAAGLAVPLYEHPRTRVYGQPGDSFGSLATIEAVAGALRGQPLLFRGAALQPLVDGPAGVLCLLVGAVPAYNLMLLASFPLGTLFAFLGARELGASRRGSLLGALLFAFSPYHLAHGAAHLDQAQVWLTALTGWRALALVNRPGPFNGAVLAFAWAFACLGNWYLSVVLAPLVLGAVLVLLVRGRGRRRAGALGALLGVSIALAAPGLALLGEDWRRSRDPGDLVRYSARLGEYLWPPPSHPVLGPWVREGFAARAHGSEPTEQTLTLGFAPLLLALAGLAARRPGEGGTAFLGLAALLALWLSLPPAWGASAAAAAVAPWFRAAARAAQVVGLAVALLGARGVDRLRPRSAVAAVLIAVFEYLPAPAAHAVEPVEASRWLETHARLVADYPVEPYRMYRLYRALEGVGGLAPGRLREADAVDLEDPRTPERLAALGVSHVVVHDETPLGEGLVERERYAGARIAEVMADPVPVLVLAGDGFHPPERGGRWLGAEPGALELEGTDPGLVLDVTLRFEALSLGEPRRLVVQEGRREHRFEVPAAGGREVELPVRLQGSGVRRLVLAASPPARSADEVLGNGDPRRLSVLLRRLRVEVERETRGGVSVRHGRGFFEREPGGRRWMGSEGAIEIEGEATRFAAELVSLGRPREVVFRCEDRRVQGLEVPAGRWLAVALALPAGCRNLSVEAGGAERIGAVTGARDPREVSVAMRRLRVE